VNIASVDLNLLVAFEALWEERHLTRAAMRVGLSQPAMSHALRRLRELIGDPLFVRGRHGLTATARAAQIAGPVHNGLAELRLAVADHSAFEPATTARTFRIAMNDYAELLLAGPLMRALRTEAPGAQVVLRRPDRLFVAPEDELRSGALDAAIGFFPDGAALDPGTRAKELFTEQNVAIARKGHPLFRKPLTPESLASTAHAAVFYKTEPRGLIDSILASHNLRRRLQAVTPHFLTVPAMVAGSDLIACVPAGLAARFAGPLRLQTRPLPFRTPSFCMRLAWHERTDADAAQRWFREVLVHQMAVGAGTSA
jgi:DNA-binding transcriptional LysR family regulator